MLYFAVQVRSASELKFIERAGMQLDEYPDKPRFIFLRRTLTVRRQGREHQEEHALFPGYVFLESQTKLNKRVITQLRRIDGFCRFLKSNTEITVLDGRSLATLSHFLEFGETAGRSNVYFDDNDRIVVTDGPMKGFEGSIIRVDRRKKRAKLKIEFNDRDVLLDLSFEIIQKGAAYDAEM